MTRQTRRRLLFPCIHWRRYTIGVPWRWVQLWLLHGYTRAKAGPIALVDYALDESNTERFLRATREALALIECIDPRAFRRIQRGLRYIINREGLLAGAYDQTLRACFIDFSRLSLSRECEEARRARDWYLSYYASVLVHEATHAWLDAAYFPYTRATRARVERICWRAERRIAVRLLDGDIERAAKLVRDFDPRQWDFAWNATFLQRLRAARDRVKQADRAARGHEARKADGV